MLDRTISRRSVCSFLLRCAACLVVSGAAAGSGEVRFAAERTVAHLGATRVLWFEASPAAEDRTLAWSLSGPSGSAASAGSGDDSANPVVEVVREPRVLAGRSRGMLRLRPLRAGVATLTLGGAGDGAREGASIEIAVASASSAAVMRAPRPRIFTPLDGAVAWGTVTVGVELFDDPMQAPGAPREVRVVMGDGTALEPIEQTQPDEGPTRRVAFELDLRGREPGPVKLVAEAASAGGRVWRSAAVWLDVVRPGAAGFSLMASEAEDQALTERPERYREGPLNLDAGPRASGGRYVVNNGAQPALAFKLPVESAGWYQLAVVAAGDPAGGVLPTVGLRLNNTNRPETATRLARRAWHRVIVGRPVRIKPGDHTALIYFENDFRAGRRLDRNLRLDRFELLRLDTPPAMDRDIEPRPFNAPGDLIVALDPALDGATLGGDVEVRGRIHQAHDHGHTGPAKATLLINGKPLATQHSDRPIFHLPIAALGPGDNTLTLRATTSRGLSARSATLTVTRLPAGNDDAPPPRVRRFLAADPAWQDLGRLDDDRHARPDRVKAWTSNAAATLRLPRDLAGTFDVLIDARGDVFEGPPIAAVELRHGQHAEAVGEAQAYRGYGRRRAGRVTLREGDKSLRVAFINDYYEKDKGDRNLFLRSVVLREVAAEDQSPPTAEVMYPERGQSVYDADAVVAQVADDRELDFVELRVDGRPTGVRRYVRGDGVGRVLLPVSLRGLSEGTHELSVVARDRAGHRTRSAAVTVDVLGSPPQPLTRYEAAVRALRRFGFGVDERQLAEALVMGHADYLRDRLSGHDAAAAWAWAVAAFPDDRNAGHVTRRALEHALHTPNPVRARFVLFIDNHLTTWLRKARPERKADEFRRLAALGPAPFADLLMHSATSPAMLEYLDQDRSFGRRLNENYAREIMELHSLGVHAGYTQQDVTELANLLTGWRYASTARLDGGGQYLDDVFRFDPALNDPDPRTVFGVRFPRVPPEKRYDRARLAIEMLAHHPETARHLATKIAEHYTDVPADPALVEALAAAFHESGGDTRAMLLALAKRDELWRRDLPPRMTHPTGYALRLGRAAGGTPAYQLDRYLRGSGFGLFDRDTPDGYPEEDPAYANTNAMLQRWRFAHDLRGFLSRLVPYNLRQPPADADEQAQRRWRQQVVDTIALRLTGGTLGPRSNDAVMRAFEQTPIDGMTHLHTVAALIAQMPEANLR